MYYPYFRGKQYELIAVRETADIMKESNFVPIIEPVKESLGGLSKTLSAVAEVRGKAVVIVNPSYGDYSRNGDGIWSLIQNEFREHLGISVGILLSDDFSTSDALALCEKYRERLSVLVHAGFTEGKIFAEQLGGNISDTCHVFIEEHCGKLYQKHFKDTTRILLRDGFKKQTNRDYPNQEFFSDLHATFEEENMNGFGDFLIVGDDYSESGGPAYAVAIHLTYIDSNRDDEMHIYHFKSIRQDDPKDPAGKFAEALNEMIQTLSEPDCQILRTRAVREFIDLHEKGHFPGLGYVKKLSMKHHIETLADYFDSVR